MFAAVDVWPHLTDYASAFHRLSAGRDWMSGGMGSAMPIRIAEMEKEAYARARLGIVAPSDAYDRFCFLVDAQDDEYLAWYAKRSKGASVSPVEAVEAVEAVETDE